MRRATFSSFPYVVCYIATHHKGTIGEVIEPVCAVVRGWVDFHRLTEPMRRDGVIIKVLHDSV